MQFEKRISLLVARPAWENGGGNRLGMRIHEDTMLTELVSNSQSTVVCK